MSAVILNFHPKAVEELRALLPAGMSLTEFAFRWILMHEAVTCAVPGAKRPEQVEENMSASDLPPLSEDVMQQIKTLYEEKVRPLVHHCW